MNRNKLSSIVMLLLVFVYHSVLADYLEVRRTATIRSEPNSQSQALHRPAVGSLLELLSGQQSNGYYLVSVPNSNEQGYIYRTLVRRYSGQLPDGQNITGRVFTTLEANESFLDRTKPHVFFHFISVGQGDATLVEFPCGVILIDAGYGAPADKDMLVGYLNEFFNKRPHLTSKVIEAVYITHNHSDHANRISDILSHFTVRRYLDNGESESGYQERARKRIRDNSLRTIVRALLTRDVIDAGGALTDTMIDPIKCQDCDPKITILLGGYGTVEDDIPPVLDNPNNRSLVIRIDFGQTSALFTGDLEEAGIEVLLEKNQATDLLDVDIYQVGHHGSINGTTQELVESMTPELAVFSMGDPNFRGSNRSAWSYGHPRSNVVNLLSTYIGDIRDPVVQRKAAKKSKSFTEVKIRKRLYGTGWDGHIIVRGDLEGRIEVATIQD